MPLFPIIWLGGAVIAGLCTWLGAGEIVLAQWFAVSLYLLSFFRWQRHYDHSQREAGRDPAFHDMLALQEAALLGARTAVQDRRFGGSAPDDLQPVLLRKLMQYEKRLQLIHVGRY